ncbi:MAG: hypothetical protein V2I37_12995 [Marinilabiliaceae bacterium]|jgi:hypothetical protein|nr:hypothetical protein [Marinilabiliaceae bacterium]
MIKKLIFAGLFVMLVSCKGGDKSPVMVTPTDDIDLNQNAGTHVAKVEKSKVKVNVKHEEGTITVADVFKKRLELTGKEITVKGEVTKFNPSIMGKNWVHIQDGTEYEGEFDLTITTSDVVNVGSQVIFTGVLAIDRDFGYGYAYSTILEKAELKK